MANDTLEQSGTLALIGLAFYGSSALVLWSRIIWIFVMSDLVTFCSQTAGTVFVIIGGSWLKLGTALEIAGLALAIVSYLWFMWIGYEFFWKLRTSFPHVYYAADGRRWTWKPQPNRPLQDVALLKLALLISSIGIVIRSIFRLVEQADGFFGFIASHEVFFWLFDAIPLWICTTVYCFVWPPRIIEACAERDVEQNLW
ncbi:RTA-like protein [Pseudohyphozyma bogoriensis]|nr:RTA-like protein [Pseudohyphozyma bogoriensis]